MSVLLDALKKAAEEKKNAEKSAEQGLSLSQEESSVQYAESDIVEEKPESKNLHIEEKVSDDLPVFNFKIQPQTDDINHDFPPPSLELPNDTSHNSELKLAFEQVAEEPIKDESYSSSVHIDEVTQDEPKDFDLASLIDSLDVDNSADSNTQVLSISSGESSVNNTMSLNTVSETDSVVAAPEFNDDVSSLDNSPNQDEHFSWAMDELPAYSENKNNDVKKRATSQPVNPVLLNTGSTAPQAHTKYATSSRIIVSLVVVLLFIGIGFYGMLYYQEQNENLEYSMRKYNLSKMQLPEKTVPASADKVEQNYEEITALNVVSNKVIALGNSLKDSVETNLIVPLAGNNAKIEAVSEAKVEADSTKSIGNNPQQPDVTQSKNVGSKTASKTNTVRVATARSHRDASSSKVANAYKKTSVNTNNRIVLTSTTKTELGKAYSAYSAGDYVGAENLFNKTLTLEPKNVNALLGLGGVAVAQGNYRLAINYYQKVLDIKPNNLYAFEAISNLSGHLELNKSWESELHEMALKYPKSAVLQYAQGNLYAKQNDWLAAQKSYFQAYALDTSNPDYMMNLAVSFDHLGKYILASEYYTQALAFADTTSVSFDKRIVKERLISIRQFIVKGQ